MSASAWDLAEQEVARVQAATGGFLKLKNDGDRAEVAFAGEPRPKKGARIDGRFRPWLDSMAGAGFKPTIRVELNCYRLDGGARQVWEVPAATFQAVAKLRHEHPFGSWAFTIVRHGAAGDMSTTYAIDPLRELTEAERASAHGDTAAPASEPGAEGGGGFPDDDIPF
jgi:hypothetical protein